MPAPRIIVIGGGLAGLSAVIKIAEAGGTALCALGLIGMFAFINPKYANAPADVMPAQPPGVTSPAPQ